MSANRGSVTEDDIAKYLDLAVVGVIPEYQGGKKK